MASHYPGPHEVRLIYRVSGQEHTMKLNCNAGGVLIAGTPAASISLSTNGGGTVNLVTAVTAWINLIRNQYNVTVEFARTELWQYTPGTFVALFITDIGVTNVGSSASATQLAQQTTMSFRTVGGNRVSIWLLETTAQNTGQEFAPFSIAALEAIRTFILSSGNWIKGRDDTYPHAAIRLSFGQNENTFNDRFRTS